MPQAPQPRKTTPEKSFADQIYRALRDEIAFGHIMPRERLVESDLCERFNTTHHNVRRALDQLDRVGLIERKVNRGATVRSFTARELEELYEVRIILQAEAARRIPLPASEELLEKVSALNAAFEANIDKGDFSAAAAANDQFHHAIFDACGNSELSNLIETYWLRSVPVHSRAIVREDMSKRSRADHREMIRALRDGDSEALVTVVTEHIRPALDVYLAQYQISPSGRGST